jgi:hypothetical protein
MHERSIREFAERTIRFVLRVEADLSREIAVAT